MSADSILVRMSTWYRLWSLTDKPVTRKITYTYLPPVPEKELTAPGIERIQTYPEGDFDLEAGRANRFSCQGPIPDLPAGFRTHQSLETPDSVTVDWKRIYQGEYVIREIDTFANRKISVGLISPDGQHIIH